MGDRQGRANAVSGRGAMTVSVDARAMRSWLKQWMKEPREPARPAVEKQVARLARALARQYDPPGRLCIDGREYHRRTKARRRRGR